MYKYNRLYPFRIEQSVCLFFVPAALSQHPLDLVLVDGRLFDGSPSLF